MVGRVTKGDWIDVLYRFEKRRREGFEVHAEAIATLLQGETLQPLGAWGQFLIMLPMSALGAWARFFRPLAPAGRRRAYSAAVVGIYLGAAIVLNVEYGVLVNTAYHIGAFFLTYWVMGKAAHWMGIWEINQKAAGQGDMFSVL